MTRSNGGEPSNTGDVRPVADQPVDRDVVRLAARAFERDRYLSALLAPAAVRDDLVALAAFAGEVARIPATIAEPMIGAIRLQWWRDTLEAVGRDATVRSGHPIADALAVAIVRHRLPIGSVVGLIDAQDLGLGDEPPCDGLALAQHLAKTEGVMFELALRILGGETAVMRWRPVVPDAAMAYGLTRLLVELPAFTAEHRTLLPADMLADGGLRLDQLYARDAAANARVQPLVSRMVKDASRHLAIASRQVSAHRGDVARMAFLPLATVAPTLRAIRRSTRGALLSNVDILPLERVMRLTWTYATGRL